MGTEAWFRVGKHALDAVDDRLVPKRITSRFSGGDDGRLRRDRMEIIPWLDRTRRLDQSRILEVGCGAGLSTVALAEQGAKVVGLDVGDVGDAAQRLADHGLCAKFVTANAQDIAHVIDRPIDWVIFWASLEHMTVAERLASLTAAWSVLPAGGLLTVIETPNRLWLDDSHTSRLSFFNWLPDDLAFRYSQYSPRTGFNDVYRDLDDKNLLAFIRHGRGVSFHEFELAIGRPLDVVACLQLERRARNPVRAIGWRISRAGRFERLLRAESPAVPRAFLQPFLYLTMHKP